MSTQPTTLNYRTVRELADDDRPREKLLRHGPAVLSDAELVAILMGSGMRGENVLDMARRLLDESGGLANLMRMDALALQQAKGLGPAKSTQLAAALELGRRAALTATSDRPLLGAPESVRDLLGPRVLGSSRERLFVLSMDTKGRLLGAPAELEGTVNTVSVRVAEVFRTPILLDAVSIIVAHNHPSGDPRPSPQDIAITAELVKAGAVLDISVEDHVVLGHGSFVSLRREGHISGKASKPR